MSAGWVLLLLGPRGRPWVERAVGLTSAGVEVLVCGSAPELRARTSSARPVSAAVVDADAPGVDRDLLAHAGRACPVVIVERGTGRPWRALGAAAVVAADCSAEQLREVLASVALPVEVPAALPGDPRSPAVPSGGRLVAVCGTGGSGASTVAAGLAQGFGLGSARLGMDGPVVLADLCRRADQAMLHDARDVAVGLQELVEAHRAHEVTSRHVRAHCLPVAARGYDLLVGLRQPRAWAALRPRAVTAALAGLRSAYSAVVADVEPDLEGEAETGSIDVEERHALARAAVRSADVVVAVGRPGLHGTHALVRLLGEVVAAAVDGARILPVVNRAPADRAARAEITATLAALGSSGERPLPPSFVGDLAVEPAFLCGHPLPIEISHDLASTVDAVTRLASVGTRHEEHHRVRPGTLGHLSRQDAW